MSANFDRAATFLRDLADVVARAAHESLGIAPERAIEFGFATAQKACDEFRGQMIYVPIGLALKIDERDRAMFEEYVRSGRDIVAVAKQFEVSVQTAYKRVKLVETALFSERQGELFPQDQ